MQSIIVVLEKSYGFVGYYGFGKWWGVWMLQTLQF
jgi:hypothetical protein